MKKRKKIERKSRINVKSSFDRFINATCWREKNHFYDIRYFNPICIEGTTPNRHDQTEPC